MRFRNTMVCVGVVALLGLTGANAALSQESDLHPVLGKKPPRALLNSDLLALPDKERQAWIHGAMSQMAQTLAAREDKSASKCVMEWYFEKGNGPELIPLALKEHPDSPPTVTIMAVTRLACPSA